MSPRATGQGWAARTQAPVTKLDAEGAKNSYVIEVSDPDTETDLTIYRITIMVVDVNDPPTAPSEHKGLPRGAEHRSGVRGDLYHQDGG